MTFYFQHVESTDADGTLGPVNAFLNSLKPIVISSIAMQPEAAVDVLDTVTGELIDSLSGSSVNTPGTANPSEALPGATQGVLKQSTGAVVAGRRIRGRLYIPGPTKTSTSSALAPPASYVTALGGAGAALISATATSGPWVVWSKKNGLAFAVEGASVWQKWGVMRSRRD